MHPVLFRFPDWLPLLGGHAIYSYGFMLGVSFILGWTLCHRWAHAEGMAEKEITRALFIIIIMSLVGARVFFFIYNPDRWRGLGGFMRFDSGGLVAYGGYIMGTLAGYLYLRFVTRTDFWNFADHAAPGMALGLGFTRIGCFLFGCCFGRRTDSFLAIRFPMWNGGSAVKLGQHGSPAFVDHFRAHSEGQVYDHVARQVSRAEAAWHSAGANVGDLAHQTYVAFEAKLQAMGALVMGGHSHPIYPSQVLASLAGFIIFAILLVVHRYRRFRGQVLLAFAGTYSIARFLLEITRVDFQGGIFGAISFNQLISIVILLFIIPAWIVLQRRSPLAPGQPAMIPSGGAESGRTAARGSKGPSSGRGSRDASAREAEPGRQARNRRDSSRTAGTKDKK